MIVKSLIKFKFFGGTMDFIDQLSLLAKKIAATKGLIQTEEATKNAMIMPLIQILGYNVFDPFEVTPEFAADIGTKKGEKVDYAILREGKPIILFECKKSGGDLTINHASQLFRYFHVTEARFGVLTNGLTYRFFTDLEQPNKMDENPFFEFHILDFKERDVDELRKFAKTAFDLATILTTANELKYTRVIQSKLAELIANPTDDFVRLVASELIGKRFSAQLKDQYSSITKLAFEQLVSEKINERLKVAMAPESVSLKDPVASSPEKITNDSDTKNQASSDAANSTTADEIEAFHTIRAVLYGTVQAKRIFMRDSQSYCAILFDDNNRKPICRLRFNNTKQLRLGVFNERREEIIHELQSIEDIFNFAETLRLTAASYIEGNGKNGG